MVGTGSNKIGEAEQNEHLFVRQSRRSAGCDGRAAATGRPQPRTALLSRCGALSARRRPGQGRLAGGCAAGLCPVLDPAARSRGLAAEWGRQQEEGLRRYWGGGQGGGEARGGRSRRAGGGGGGGR